MTTLAKTELDHAIDRRRKALDPTFRAKHSHVANKRAFGYCYAGDPEQHYLEAVKSLPETYVWAATYSDDGKIADPFQRPALQKLMKEVRFGDVIMCGDSIGSFGGIADSILVLEALAGRKIKVIFCDLLRDIPVGDHAQMVISLWKKKANPRKSKVFKRKKPGEKRETNKTQVPYGWTPLKYFKKNETDKLACKERRMSRRPAELERKACQQIVILRDVHKLDWHTISSAIRKDSAYSRIKGRFSQPAHIQRAYRAAKAGFPRKEQP